MIRKKMDGYAIVTAAASGIGRGIVLDLADEGYDVVINDLPSAADRAQKVVEACEAKGVRAIAALADVSSFEGTAQVVSQAVEAFGEKICILGNVAGISPQCEIMDETEENLRRVVEVDLMSALFMIRQVTPYMSKLGYGSIISISSIGPLIGVQGQAAYNASKFGLVGMSRGLAIELAKYNIRVNTIAPGTIETYKLKYETDPEVAKWATDLIPLKRLGQPEDIAQCFTYLCNNDFITGQNISPNGGVAFL